jgi:hypothetical protein
MPPEITKIAPQRPRYVSLTSGNAVIIFASWTWVIETGLAGWAERTRTQKWRRKLSL